MSMGYITMYRLSSCDTFKYGSKPKIVLSHTLD